MTLLFSPNKIARALSFAALLFLLSGCASREPKNRLYLDRNWFWSLSGVEGSFSPLDAPELANLENIIPGGSGEIWLRCLFEIPGELRERELAVYLGRITMADRTFLNGEPIGGEGIFERDAFSQWNKARIYPLPRSAFAEGERQELLVRIRADHEGSIVSSPFIGTADDAGAAALTETFWNATVNELMAAVMIVIALYHLFLFAMRPGDRETLVFALLNLFTAIYISNFFITELPLMPPASWSFLAFQKLIANALPFALTYMMASFVLIFLGRREGHAVKLIRILLLAVPLGAIFLARDYGELRALRGWTQAFLFPPILYVLYLQFDSLRKGNRESVTLLVGFAPLALIIAVDILLHEAFRLYSLPYFTSLGWQILILSLLFVLSHRFATARTEVEVLNQGLELKVAERTRELSEANGLLTEANEDLLEARERADRDMKMAAFVQRSFFPAQAPRLDGWDIAYEFRPMAGVSGDLYDFYAEGKELLGMSLFDVSGHGIASGLVTMLAKNAVFREFRRGRGTSLPALMRAVDRAIIRDKGSVENYLTGILLRVAGDRVEYANAGHPDLLFRSGKTGKAAPVRVEGKDQKGRMLGIEGMSEGFGAIAFNMAEGDALLLYTDCLTESRGADGSEWGPDRLTQSFSSSGDLDAASRLENILSDFSAFTGGVPLKDDLTAVIAVRRNGKRG